MADTKELKLAGKEVKKEPWTLKKVLTTVVIVILALLMVGGASYIIASIQQGKDTSNIYGYYDGEPIKYEYNSLFYNTLVSDSNYINALYSGDINTLFSSMSQAYQRQVVFTALSKMANKAKIASPESIIDRMIIESGNFASEDGSSTFDPEVYKAASVSDRNVIYNYFEKMYPYQELVNDYTTVKTSSKENEFILEFTKETRDFNMFVIDYSVFPDEEALAYDISGMEKTTDADGNEVEPSLDEIKAYIFTSNPDAVTPYIDEALASASSVLETGDFAAASEFGSGIIDLDGVANNAGGSQFISGLAENDTTGYLASVADESLYNQLFTASKGDVFGPIPVGSFYVFLEVENEDSDVDSSYLTDLFLQYFAQQIPTVDLQNSIFTSDKFEDNFYTKFLETYL